MPTNLTIINYKFNYQQQHTDMRENVLYIWPDGSIKSNQNNIKIGGFGVYIETYKLANAQTNIALPETEWFLAMGKQYDINYVESNAIHNAMFELHTNYKSLLTQNNGNSYNHR